jgi:malonyl-CoA/methylmalonyl-CoA synthetase
VNRVDKVSSLPIVGESERIDDNHRAMLVYTSGTTGQPKGVVSSHGMINAQTSCLVDEWQWTSEDHILHVLPLHHVHGIINVLTCSLWSGARCTFLPKFNAKTTWDFFAASPQRLAAYGGPLNLFMAVPTIYAKLISEYNQATPDEQASYRAACRRFRLFVSGSAALPGSPTSETLISSLHQLAI